VAAAVGFRRAALDDIARYEAWRIRQNPSWRSIGSDLVDAIQQAASRYPTFDAIPVPLLTARGRTAFLKRLLVPVRSKVFRVYVGPGREPGEISVRRVLHPSRRSIERP
jgi:hypothetical protein